MPSNTTKPINWTWPNAIYNPSCPVNLLPMDRFHYTPSDMPTGHRVDFLDSSITLATGEVLPMRRDPITKLYMLEILPTISRESSSSHSQLVPRTALTQTRRRMREISISDAAHSHFVRTHIRQLTKQRWMRRTLASKHISNESRSKGTVLGLNQLAPFGPEDQYPSGYYLGKMTARSAATSANIEPLGKGIEILSDIGGKMPVESIVDKYLYFVLFKCRTTKHRYIYFMKEKSELALRFQQFIAASGLVDKQIHKFQFRPRLLVTDDDRSYFMGEMEKLCAGIGVVNYRVGPHSHNRNPIENDMRRLGELATGLLHQAGLPYSFWPYSYSYACYILNRLFTRSHSITSDQYKSPLQRRYLVIPHVDDFVVFGCKTHPEQARS